MKKDNEHFQAFENWLGHKLPDRLYAVLAEQNGEQCGELIRFYAPDELVERNETYQTKQYCPGWITIADDGGGSAVIVATDLSVDTVFMVDHGAMTPDCFVPLATDLTRWVNELCPVKPLAELIKTELMAAFKQLPASVTESDNGYCQEAFMDYFNTNQLLLAMEELDGVIEDNPSPSRAFWLHLINASRLMDNKHLVKYQSILSATYQE